MREGEDAVIETEQLSDIVHARQRLMDLFVERERSIPRMIDAVSANCEPHVEQGTNLTRGEIWTLHGCVMSEVHIHELGDPV